MDLKISTCIFSKIMLLTLSLRNHRSTQSPKAFFTHDFFPNFCIFRFYVLVRDPLRVNFCIWYKVWTEAHFITNRWIFTLLKRLLFFYWIIMALILESIMCGPFSELFKHWSVSLSNATLSWLLYSFTISSEIR